MGVQYTVYNQDQPYRHTPGSSSHQNALTNVSIRSQENGPQQCQNLLAKFCGAVGPGLASPPRMQLGSCDAKCQPPCPQIVGACSGQVGACHRHPQAHTVDAPSALGARGYRKHGSTGPAAAVRGGRRRSVGGGFRQLPLGGCAIRWVRRHEAWSCRRGGDARWWLVRGVCEDTGRGGCSGDTGGHPWDPDGAGCESDDDGDGEGDSGRRGSGCGTSVERGSCRTNGRPRL